MKNINTKSLLAIYDLYSYAPTFNIYEFLTGAKIHANILGCNQIDFLILRRSLNTALRLQPQAINEYDYRVNDVLINSTQMFPISHIFIHHDESNIVEILKSYQFIFPESFSYSLFEDKLNSDRYFLQPYLRDYFLSGNAIPSIAPPAFAFKLMKKYLINYIDKFITITIRNAMHLTGKNSNTNIWQTVAKFFENYGYKVIIIPDIESIDSLPNIDPLGHMCASNQSLRSALYDSAVLNLGVNNGAIAPLMFNANARMLLSKLYTDGTNTNKQFFTEITGISPLTGSWCKVPWHQFIFSEMEDADEIIDRSFKLINDVIEINEFVSKIPNNQILLDPWKKLDGTIFPIADLGKRDFKLENFISTLKNDSFGFSNPKSLIIRALSAYLKNNYEDALQFSKQTILLDGRYADPFLICAIIYKKENKEHVSNKYLQSTVNLFPIFFEFKDDEWFLKISDSIKDILLKA